MRCFSLMIFGTVGCTTHVRSRAVLNLVGSVKDPTGAPIAGALIRVIDTGLSDTQRGHVMLQTTSGTDGAVRASTEYRFSYSFRELPEERRREFGRLRAEAFSVAIEITRAGFRKETIRFEDLSPNQLAGETPLAFAVQLYER